MTFHSAFKDMDLWEAMNDPPHTAISRIPLIEYLLETWPNYAPEKECLWSELEWKRTWVVCFFDFCSVQNKENVGQMTSTSGGAGGGLRFKRFNLNR